MLEPGAATLPDSTIAWVQAVLGPDVRLISVQRLLGGWTSDMRRLRTESAAGERSYVLRSFSKPFYVRHAEGLLQREADVLGLLDRSGIPAARVVALDARAEHCDHPSLLRTHLPGAIALDEAGAPQRGEQLAEMLARIHALDVPSARRPRPHQLWTPPELTRMPDGTERPEPWTRALQLVRRPAPVPPGCFLHRDYHPGNVLFDGGPGRPRISGIVDWVETSWGPADLDVAHCSTALALLHGASHGLGFADHYVAAGGKVAADPAARLYFYLLDALHYAPNPEKLATPWREVGRVDLTPERLCERMDDYVLGLLARFDS